MCPLALDRFAQFFIAPLMKQETMQREREAVDSEFEMALQSDYNRKQQIFSLAAKKGHPMGKFMWGNLKSLQMQGVSWKKTPDLLRGRDFVRKKMCKEGGIRGERGKRMGSYLSGEALAQ